MLRLMRMITAALSAALLTAAPSTAQPSPPLGLEQGKASAAPALTAVDAAAYFDGLVPYALKRGDMAGAAVVVVKDGEVLFAKGYGYADVQTRAPVNVETTPFRQASISKLFVWTAVMQLVEQGKLDLDRDVNAYLDFKIPAQFGAPVTLRALMTHTGGFGETYRELMTPDEASTPSLEAYVKGHLPARIYRPGTTVAYSNYGATLAGYIVQRVSREPFEQYVARHIFTPLGMRHSTFIQPPQGLGVATGYRRASEGPYPFEFAGDVPAGGLSASSMDMARFMIAHLQQGRAGEGRILADATTAQMHATAFRQIPALNGMALGFYEESRNGRRIVGHAGDLISFHTDLHLLTKDGVGLYIAMNSWGRNDASSSLRGELFRGFLDRYYPVETPNEPTTPTAKQHGQELVGQYAPSRRSSGNLGTLIDLLGQGHLSLADDGVISFSKFVDAAGQPKWWREVGPYVWREVGGSASLAAKVDNGRVAAMFTDDHPAVFVFTPVSAWNSAKWRLPVLVVAALTVLIASLSWPLRPFFRWCANAPATPSTQSRAARWAARSLSLGNLVFLVGWAVIVLQVGGNPSILGPRLDPWLRLLQLAGVFGMAGALLLLATTTRDILRRKVGWRRLVADLVLVAAGLIIAAFAFSYHLLSLGLNY